MCQRLLLGFSRLDHHRNTVIRETLKVTDVKEIHNEINKVGEIIWK